MHDPRDVVHSLRLVDFRCFQSASFHFEAPVTFFIGANAQGKTSLLEALCVASRLQSPRASRQSQIVRFGCTGCGLSLSMGEEHFKAVYQEESFSLFKEGEPLKRRDYLQAAPRVVWMENRDMELVRGSGERRRRYLDTLGSQLSADYARTLRSYQKALRSRNALLKDRQAGTPQFKVFTELLLSHGNTLITARDELVRALLPLVTKHSHTISKGHESISLRYASGHHPALFETALRDSAAQESVMKQTMVGPHRGDLELQLGGHRAADYGSEGQQRTLTLALKLAQGSLLARRQAAPVLYLVDDVFGELDPTRRAALLASIPSEAQQFLTTTALNWDFSGPPPQIITLPRSA